MNNHQTENALVNIPQSESTYLIKSNENNYYVKALRCCEYKNDLTPNESSLGTLDFKGRDELILDFWNENLSC